MFLPCINKSDDNDDNDVQNSEKKKWTLPSIRLDQCQLRAMPIIFRSLIVSVPISIISLWLLIRSFTNALLPDIYSCLIEHREDREVKTHTLPSGTSPYRPYKGEPLPAPPHGVERD